MMILKSSLTKKKIVTKMVAPDPGAALNWLKNRQKKLWRDKVEHGFTDEEGKDVKPIIYLPDNGRARTDKAPERVSGESS